MTRLCFLVVDPEHAGSISTRKLVLETAKHNVITAYSCAEALKTLERFPAVDGVVLSAAMPNESCRSFFEEVGSQFPGVRRILVGTQHESGVPAEVYVEGFSPALLLERIQGIFPQQVAALERQEERLRD